MNELDCAARLPEITEVERLTVRPGDRLVLHIEHTHVTDKDVYELKERFRAALRLGDDVPVAVLGPGVRLHVVEGPS